MYCDGMDHGGRIRRLRRAIDRSSLDGLWIHPGVDFRYLTGLNPIALERLLGLIVPASGPLRLVVPALSAEECSVIDDCEAFTWSDEQGPERATAAALQGIKVLGCPRDMPLWAHEAVRRAAPEVTTRLESSLVGALRAVKDADEIEALRTASKETDGVAGWVSTLDLEGVTESRLASRLVMRFLELGMTPSPEPIVATGANASMPHYTGGDIPIDPDAPLLLDFGGAVDGYWSDITRVYFPERSNDEVRRAYDVVVEAHEAAFGAAGPGVPCEAVDAAARRVIEAAGHGERFIHRTGHGLGLEIHEPPFIRAGESTELRQGHVFTIEPGIYVEGSFGLRYENVVVVTADGVESLNAAPALHRLSRRGEGA